MSSSLFTPEQLFSFRYGCTHYIPGVPSSYGYIPTLGIGVTFDVLFGLSLLIHLRYGIKYREITSALLATGALGEALGWAARTWSSKCPYSRDAFLMQTTSLIIAPTFFTAAAYVILGRLIILTGAQSSYFRPRTYVITFVICDLISLIVQAVGGSIASRESNKMNGNTKPGTNIMVAGIVFQMASMSAFVGVLIDYMIRCNRTLGNNLSTTQFRVIMAMIFSVIAVYIRSVYRTVELLQGWEGYLITHERFFIGFDAALMCFAVGIYHTPSVNFQVLQARSLDISPPSTGNRQDGVEQTETKGLQGS
ncbi:rta1 domain-containing protein [Phlyctema vagabunda]|uniref:Rta1 domain-containing protein n=1 Tax=Phlyctema vagabunda TaxID=108571 RepID=A0ABR4PSV6_9HELO